jgi:hypothetical protein
MARKTSSGTVVGPGVHKNRGPPLRFMCASYLDADVAEQLRDVVTHFKGRAAKIMEPCV